ncbi:DUF1799 domain-containing protein [[Empedobacter] haloabium]|uniref:DUF1799 domain-containing protein n=1 Tax=[Empedobacter] haloabium TaxID=592317 RepID=A0ABZ1USQ0_9BURK
MYEKQPSVEELAAWGLTPEDVATVVDVWAENAPVVRLFQTLRTQWYMGMGGATGLRYLVAFHKMDRMDLSEDEYADMEADVRVMEYAALDAMHSK